MPSSNFQRTCNASRPGTYLDLQGSLWYKNRDKDKKGPMEQMFEHAKQHGHRFMAASDYSPIGAPKMYASYPTCEDFITETLLKTERKHFYELIPEGQPCKFFLDIEWVGPHDPEKALALIHYVVDKLKKYAQVRAPELGRCVHGKHMNTFPSLLL